MAPDEGLASAGVGQPGSNGAVTGSTSPGSGSAGTGGGSPTTTPPVSPPSPTPGSSGIASTTPSTAATGSSPPLQGGTPAQQQTLRDLARSLGYQAAGQHQDDHSFFSHMLLQAQQAQQLEAQLRQSQQYVQLGQEYQQHRTEFQKYLAAQQQAKQPEQPPWFKAPEYDPAWRTKLTRDATGQLVPVQGAPPDLVSKYLTAAEHRENFIDKFAFDPVGTIRPGIEEVVRSMAAEIVQQQLGSYQAKQEAGAILKQNSDWLFAKNPQGQMQYSQSGQPELSPAGKVYRQYAQQAAQIGIQDDRAIHDFAFSMLQRDLSIMQLQRLQAGGQQTPPPGTQAQQVPPPVVDAGEQAKQGFLQQARAGQQHQPQHAGSTNGNGAQNASLSLEDRMRQNFKAAGVTDEQVRQTITRRR